RPLGVPSPRSRGRCPAAKIGPRPPLSDSTGGTREVLVDELHGHRPLAYGRGATLAGAGPDVAGGEDAGHARLEQVVGAGCGAGEDEAVGGACDGVVEPFRARLRAEEEEEKGE